VIALATGAVFSAATAAATVPKPTVNRFDAGRAFAELRAQVALGPRPAGSPTLRTLATQLKAKLPHGRYEAFSPVLRNIVGRLPGRKPAIVIGAHYDTKDIPGYVGANNGAGGTAAVIELARDLGKIKRRRGAPELRFVLFDGEEAPAGTSSGDFLRFGLRGSRAYVRAHRGQVKAMILLDFVANPNLRLPRELGSDPQLWGQLRAAARRVGVARVFPNRTFQEIEDDHTSFTAATSAPNSSRRRSATSSHSEASTPPARRSWNSYAGCSREEPPPTRRHTQR
jgi:glutaminyl-peptide cyclotransferase